MVNGTTLHVRNKARVRIGDQVQPHCEFIEKSARDHWQRIGEIPRRFPDVYVQSYSNFSATVTCVRFRSHDARFSWEAGKRRFHTKTQRHKDLLSFPSCLCEKLRSSAACRSSCSERDVTRSEAGRCVGAASRCFGQCSHDSPSDEAEQARRSLPRSVRSSGHHLTANAN